MAGIVAIAVGIILAAAGIFLLLLGGGFALIGWIVLAAGIVAVGAGLVRTLSVFMRPDETVETDEGAMEIRLLIQSMAAMASADGHIDESEIAEFARIYARVTGLDMPPARIRSILAEIDQDFDIAGRLRDQRPRLTPEVRSLILKSCHQVMMSDAIEDRTETAKIRDIADALGFDERQLERIAMS